MMFITSFTVMIYGFVPDIRLRCGFMGKRKSHGMIRFANSIDRLIMFAIGGLHFTSSTDLNDTIQSQHPKPSRQNSTHRP